jgi:hypothetical protein
MIISRVNLRTHNNTILTPINQMKIPILFDILIYFATFHILKISIFVNAESMFIQRKKNI